MLKTLEPRGIFGSNYAYLYILRLPAVYQISSQEKCLSEQFYFIFSINSKESEPSRIISTVIWVSRIGRLIGK